ncbi:hypothetical protein [Aquimarina sp. AU119]|uniref:hypothetical protein n=1 Tax=Aquimarina sp. AU119 TaxID=2108528 RepID=UPI000D6866F9|nr:hypothetical protein [Aquimarina sp. AU119]
MNINKPHYKLVALFVLLSIKMIGQSKEEKSTIENLLQKNAWFITTLFLEDKSITEYELTPINNKQQYKDSLGASIVEFYKKSTTLDKTMRFASFENLPRCGNDESEDYTIYGVYTILKNNTLQVEIIEAIGNEAVLVGGVFEPIKTKKQTYLFEIIKKENKVFLKKIAKK